MKKKRVQYRVIVSARLPRPMLPMIARYAKRQGETRTGFIETAIAERIEKLAVQSAPGIPAINPKRRK